MWWGSKWDVGLWNLQPSGIKDQTPNYKGAGGAGWPLPVIPAGVELVCVCVCVCDFGPAHASSRCFPWVKLSYPSRAWSYLFSLFLQLWVSHPCPGWNLQPWYRRAFPSLHGSSFNVHGNAKEPAYEVLHIQHYKAGFFQSSVCLRITKVHAEAWLHLLPTHLCILQPAVMSKGKKALQNYYIKLSYQVASANLKHQGAHPMLLELLPISELNKSNMQLPILTNLYFSSSQTTCNLNKHPREHFKIYHLLHIVGTST